MLLTLMLIHHEVRLLSLLLLKRPLSLLPV